MHRSQLDPLYDEEGASKMVLHPVDDFTVESEFYQRMRAEQEAKVELKKTATDVLSAVDEYGIPKDGYNYKQHLRTSGGGVFVLPDGTTTTVAEPVVSAPLETLAEDQPERMFEAITLTTDGMPEDIRQALDSDYDEEFYDEEEDGAAPEGRIIGEFEELQMDFIQVASVESEEPVGFDFDAHIARLMRRADGIFSDDEDGGESGGKSNDRKQDDRHEEQYDEDEDGEEFDLEALGLSEADFGGPVPDRRIAAAAQEEFTSLMPAPNTTRDRRDLDDQFDVLWEREYGDQLIGDLDEELCANEDGLAEQMDGLKLDGATVDTLMEEFLQEEEERTMPLILQQHEPRAERSGETKNDRMTALMYEEDENDETSSQIAHAIKPDTGERTDQGWSREDRFLPKRLRQTWDVESVISTYSNVDNHPTVVGANYRRSQTVVGGKKQNQKNPGAPNTSGKKMLPIGSLGRYDDDSSEEEEEEDYDDDEYDDEGDSKEYDAVPVNKGVKRPKKETSAQKKARKRALKEERRLRRQIKKQTKQVFKEETKKQLKNMRASDGISVTPLN